MAQPKTYRYNREERNKTIALIGVLLVLIVVIGGALIYIISQRAPATVTPANQTNTTSPPVIIINASNGTNVTPSCDDQCMLAKAVSDQSFSECQQLSSEGLRQSCYSQLSSVSLGACEALSNSTARDSCVTAFAVSQNDTTICDALTGGKQSCQLAVNPCANAADKPLCSALSSSDASKCGTDQGCLLNYSLTAKNSSACALIQDQVTADACASGVTYTDKCSGLPQISQRDLCYQLYATYSNNYLECLQITRESSYATDCFSYFAAKLQNMTICNYFTLDQKWACLRQYSLYSGDINGCKAIDPLASTNRFLCAFNYSIKFGDPSACQVITQNLGEVSTCYQGAIIYSNQNLDYHNCANVTDFVWQNACYTAAAKLDNNVAICNYITADFAKQSCQDAYAAYVNRTT